MRSKFTQAFYQALAPMMAKQQVLSDLEEVEKLMVEFTLPMLSVDDGTGKNSKVTKAVDRALSLHDKGYRGKPIAYMRKVLEHRIKEHKDLVEWVDKMFADDIVKQSIDYRRMSVLQYISGMKFYAEYIRKYMLVIIKEEVDDVYKPVDKNYREFCEDRDNLDAFGRLSKIMSEKLVDIDSSLEKLKGISFNGDTAEAMAATSRNGVDPLKMGFIPLQFNIFYIAGSLWNEFVVYRYELAKEQRSKLEIEIMYLKRKAEGAEGEDLKELEKQIQYHTNRINKLTAKIEDIEEDAKG